jgi:hypothetical protein
MGVAAQITARAGSTTAVGGVRLATNPEVIAGTLGTVAATPAGIAAKFTVGTADLAVGAPLATGTFYFQYE